MTTVEPWLAQKPTARCFPTDLRTARRVAELILNRFGVAFHPHYLRAWLTQRDYSPFGWDTRVRLPTSPVDRPR
jgi:hypothetical protein